MTDSPTGPRAADCPYAVADSPGGDVVPLRAATKAWFQISLQTFGGPAGQIALMQHMLVDEKGGSGRSGSCTP